METPRTSIEPILPDDFSLLEGEELISILSHPKKIRETQPSSLAQLIRLTRAKSAQTIGEAGPSIAALSFDGEASSEHLKLYEAVFGRDSLRVAIDLIHTYPALARTTLLELASLQGTTYNKWREEEPGRIVHEVRDPNSPIAQELTEKLGWQWPYYGSVDATPEFIRTLVAYVQLSEENRAFLSVNFTDQTGHTKTITNALEAALEWIDYKQAQNSHGLIEYKSTIPRGIENQVWKDSWDAYHHQDGSLANHEQGIASLEVQVTTYDALIDAAELYEDIFEKQDYARELRTKAAALRETVLSLFWCNDEYLVLGLDKNEFDEYRQMRIKTSNMGHALNSRILKGDDARTRHIRTATVKHLFSPTLLAPAGIRTLASDEVRYRPGAYHCGSVWLWDTHHIAKGLRRLGYDDKAADLDTRILQAVHDTRMFPEYVRGSDTQPITTNTRSITVYDHTYRRNNKVEQPPQEIQAWTVAAIVATKYRLSKTVRQS